MKKIIIKFLKILLQITKIINSKNFIHNKKFKIKNWLPSDWCKKIDKYIEKPYELKMT
jgi:hypothetical protein